MEGAIPLVAFVFGIDYREPSQLVLLISIGLLGYLLAWIVRRSVPTMFRTTKAKLMSAVSSALSLVGGTWLLSKLVYVELIKLQGFRDEVIREMWLGVSGFAISDSCGKILLEEGMPVKPAPSTVDVLYKCANDASFAFEGHDLAVLVSLLLGLFLAFALGVLLQLLTTR